MKRKNKANKKEGKKDFKKHKDFLGYTAESEVK